MWWRRCIHRAVRPESPAVVTRSGLRAYGTAAAPRTAPAVREQWGAGRSATARAPANRPTKELRSFSPRHGVSTKRPKARWCLIFESAGLMAGNWYVNGRPIGEGQQQHSFGAGETSHRLPVRQRLQGRHHHPRPQLRLLHRPGNPFCDLAGSPLDSRHGPFRLLAENRARSMT